MFQEEGTDNLFGFLQTFVSIVPFKLTNCVPRKLVGLILMVNLIFQ